MTTQENSILTELELGQTNKKIKHYAQTLTQTIHHFYLYGEIEDDIEKYSDLLNILKTASEIDTVMIYINSEGGSMRMALQIINSMLSSACKTVTSLEGEAISAASMIFLAGEEYIVNDNCSFMIHTYSGGMRGKGNELFSQLEHVHANVKKVLHKFYSKILTEEELEQMIEGRDIWMDSDKLIERLEMNSNTNTSEKELDNEEGNGVESDSENNKGNINISKARKRII